MDTRNTRYYIKKREHLEVDTFISIHSKFSSTLSSLHLRERSHAGEFRNIRRRSLFLDSPPAKAWNRRRSGGTKPSAVRRIERQAVKEDGKHGRERRERERERRREEERAESLLDGEEPVGPWEVHCSRCASAVQSAPKGRSRGPSEEPTDGRLTGCSVGLLLAGSNQDIKKARNSCLLLSYRKARARVNRRD